MINGGLWVHGFDSRTHGNYGLVLGNSWKNYLYLPQANVGNGWACSVAFPGRRTRARVGVMEYGWAL